MLCWVEHVLRRGRQPDVEPPSRRNQHGREEEWHQQARLLLKTIPKKSESQLMMSNQKNYPTPQVKPWFLLPSLASLVTVHSAVCDLLETKFHVNISFLRCWSWIVSFLLSFLYIFSSACCHMMPMMYASTCCRKREERVRKVRETERNLRKVNDDWCLHELYSIWTRLQDSGHPNAKNWMTCDCESIPDPFPTPVPVPSIQSKNHPR